MHCSKERPFRWLVALVALLAVVLAAPASAGSDSDSDSDSDDRRSMTGTWVTPTPAPFVLQDPNGFAPGIPGPLKESTFMRWELEQDENGLIIGYNTYYSEDEAGGNVSRGTLCMVGAQTGSRVIFSEAFAVYFGIPLPAESTTAIFVFDCEQDGKNEMSCIGNGLSNIQPTALQARLVRPKRLPDGVPPVPEAAREICQPGS